MAATLPGSAPLTTYAVTYSYPTWDRYYRGQVGVRVAATSERDALERIRRGTAGTGYRACPDAQLVRVAVSRKASAA